MENVKKRRLLYVGLILIFIGYIGILNNQNVPLIIFLIELAIGGACLLFLKDKSVYVRSLILSIVLIIYYYVLGPVHMGLVNNFIIAGIIYGLYYPIDKKIKQMN